MSKHLLSDRQLNAVKFILNLLMQSEYNKYMDKILLYGSCARGEQTPDSDVDIFVVMSDEFSNLASDDNVFITLTQLKAKAAYTDDVRQSVDLHFTSGNEWMRNSGLYYSRIRKEGIVLWQNERT